MGLFFAIIIALNSAPVLTNGAEFAFLDSKHRFPDTREGVLLTHDFEFRNPGDAPLIINKYEVACTCTKVTFPKEPIPAGERGKISMSFDTNGKYGYQARKILIYTNARKKPYSLLFKVTVLND